MDKFQRDKSSETEFIYYVTDADGTLKDQISSRGKIFVENLSYRVKNNSNVIRY